MNPDDIARALAMMSLYALPGLVYVVVVALILPAIRRRRAARAIAAAEVEAVAQAIARCYGHGPLAVMDPRYQDEFRRDARAALAAMKRRPS